MIELLEKLKIFKISTALNPSRDISFERPFVDEEFDEYKLEGRTIILIKDGKTLVKLEKAGKYLSGNDSRLGIAELRPLKKDEEEFIEYFKVDNKAVLNPPPKAPEKAEKVVVISNTRYEGYQNEDLKGSLFELYNKLFTNGADLILNINFNLDPQAVKLLETISNQFLSDKIGSVQVVSQKTGSPSELSEETGDWKCFAINQRTWLKIKEKMKNKDFNFYSNLTKQFNEKRLKRLSTNMSRKREVTPQDSRRTKFEVI